MNKAQIQKLALKKKNEAFKKMTPAQKRVTVAQDVLDWLRVELIRTDLGGYLHFGHADDGLDWDERWKLPAEEHLARVGCDACAIGACFVATVMRKDKITVDEASHAGGREMIAYMRGIFSKSQLRLMEVAFEGSRGLAEGCTQAQMDAALDLYRRHAHLNYPKRRQKLLRAIMRNVIRNEGEFCP